MYHWINALPSSGKWEKLQQLPGRAVPAQHRAQSVPRGAEMEPTGAGSDAGCQHGLLCFNCNRWVLFVIQQKSAVLLFPFLLVTPVLTTPCAFWGLAELLLVSCEEGEPGTRGVCFGGGASFVWEIKINPRFSFQDLAMYINEVKRDKETLKKISEFQSSIENLVSWKILIPNFN